MDLTEKICFYSTVLFTGIILDVGIISTYKHYEESRLSNPTIKTTRTLHNQYTTLRQKENSLDSLSQH